MAKSIKDSVDKVKKANPKGKRISLYVKDAKLWDTFVDLIHPISASAIISDWVADGVAEELARKKGKK